MRTPTDARTVHQSRLKDLCVKNYQGTDHEWAQVVSLVLGQSAKANEPALTGIEASASIAGSGDEDKEIVITIRKRVQAITVRGPKGMGSPVPVLT